jgi:hypothetical protein
MLSILRKSFEELQEICTTTMQPSHLTQSPQGLMKKSILILSKKFARLVEDFPF